MKQSYIESIQSKSCKESATLLLLRVVVGAAFIAHGWGKVQAISSWMGPNAPVPGFLQALAAISEFGGGISLVLGLLVPVFSLGLIVTMAVATFFHVSKGDPFVGPEGHFEPALVYLALFIYIFVASPGKLSVDAKLLGVGKGNVRQ